MYIPPPFLVVEKEVKSPEMLDSISGDCQRKRERFLWDIA